MTLYQKFQSLDLDREALGLAPWTDWTDYFCTPKGARIIGGPGVDGIHFCFVRGFRDMVFAISPENLPGEYVHPIAKTFRDFLRLLLACGVDAMEQCWGWTKEEFEDFLEKYPRLEEEKTALAVIQTAFSLKPMDEPYNYIHEVQAQFDISRLKFDSEELNLSPEEPESPGWHVRWPGSDTDCVEYPLDKQYFWDDQIVWVPSLYVGEQGMIVDFCTEVAPERIQAHLNRWMPRFQAGTPLTRAEEQQQMRENPLTGDTVFRIFVGGTELQQKNGSQSSWIPPELYEESIDPEDRQILEHYDLNPHRGWILWRNTYPWPKDRPRPVGPVLLSMEQEPQPFPVLTLDNPRPGETYPIRNPVTGSTYAFRVIDCRAEELEDEDSEELTFPRHCTVLTYGVEPELSPEQLRVQDLCRADSPRYKDPARNQDCMGIAFVCGTRSREESGRTAASSLHFEPEAAQWEVAFRQQTRENFIRVLLDAPPEGVRNHDES